MGSLDELWNKHRNDYTLLETLRLHNFNDAADWIESLQKELETWKFRGRNFVPYPVNMFGPVELSPLLGNKVKLERFFGKP